MCTPVNVDTIACNDLSALATFQAMVYGNNMLMFAEKKSFGSVVTTPQSDSVITPKSASQTPTTYKNIPLNIALNDAQNSLDSLNTCKHKQVTRWQQKMDSINIAMHYIECDDCGKELYHFSERTYQQKNNDNYVVTEIKKEIIRKDNNWYYNVYSKCKHPQKFRENSVCKRCGSIYFVLH
eukprot:UN00557